MRNFSKAIAIIFTIITGIFMIIDLIIGNPSHELVHPGIVMLVLFLMGITGIKAAGTLKP